MTTLVKGILKGRRTRIQRERVEAKKLKRVATKNVADGAAIQLCLTAYTAKDVLECIPRGVKINHIRFRWENEAPAQKIEPKKAVMEIAHVYHRIRGQSDHIEIRMSDVSPMEALQKINRLSEFYPFTSEKIRVSDLSLSKDGAILMFRYCLKDLPDGADKRVKTRVLAWERTNREPALEKKAREIAASLHISKFQCTLLTSEKKIAVCTKLI